MSEPVGLVPAGIVAFLFDLDGVITQTAKAHAAAWKQMFDGFMEAHRPEGGDHTPFRLPEDYVNYVDGKLRLDGTRAFLASRQIVIPEGSSHDAPTAVTVHGLSQRKNELVLDVIRREGVDVYEGSLRFVRAIRDTLRPVAVVSASKNCAAVLAAAGLSDLFDVRVDGVVAEERGLRGKPAPDMFLAAADALAAAPSASAVFEDAIAGVEAGRAGAFGWVVGVDRVGHADELRTHGADIVVSDLADLMVAS